MSAEIIADLLRSPEYANFLEGSERLSSLETLPELEEFHRYIEIIENDHLRSLFQKHLFRLFSSDLMEVNGFCLGVLLENATLPSKEVRTEALSFIEEFFESGIHSYFKKLIAIRRSYGGLSPEAKRVATRFIGLFQLREAHSLLLGNLSLRDPELCVLTLEIFRRSRDTRANRFIRQLAEQREERKISLKSFEVLSELGNFFDQKVFRRLLQSSDLDDRRAAIRGLYRLRGHRSLSLLTAQFKESKNSSERDFILEVLGAGSGEKEVDALLKLWQGEVSDEEDRKIEWLLGEIDNRRKLGPILENYNSAPEAQRHRYIIILNEINSQECLDFYSRALGNEKNPFLLISIMEALAYYDRPESIPLLRSQMGDPESFIHYYAFSSIVRHSCIDLTDILEEVALLKLPDDRHHHQLILSVLAHQKSLTKLSTFLQAYGLFMLKSERSENRYLAYMVVGKFYLLFELRGVFDLFSGETSELVIEEGRRVFGEIFAKAPRAFMEANPPATVLESDAFARGVTPTPSLLLSLIAEKRFDLCQKIESFHPKSFRDALLLIANENLLDPEILGRVDLTGLGFRDFELLWKNYSDVTYARAELLRVALTLKDQRIGEYLFEEYLSRPSNDLQEIVTDVIGGHP